MQTFSTEEVRHNFVVDGVQYYLPGATIDDLEIVADTAKLETTEEIVAAFRDHMLTRVHPQRRTLTQWWNRQKSAKQAVRALSIKQVSQLFNEWSGLSKALGERSASHD